MSGKIVKLVTGPTVSDDCRASVIALLEDTLEEAKRGDISEIVVLIQHADPHEWSDRSSFSTSILSWVGRLETAKLDWIAKYHELSKNRKDQ